MQDQDEQYKISANLDKESFDKLIKLAKTHDRPVSAQLRVMIKEWKN